MKNKEQFTCVYAGPEYFARKNKNKELNIVDIIFKELGRYFPKQKYSVSTINEPYPKRRKVLFIDIPDADFSNVCIALSNVARNIPIILEEHDELKTEVVPEFFNEAENEWIRCEDFDKIKVKI